MPVINRILCCLLVVLEEGHRYSFFFFAIVLYAIDEDNAARFALRISFSYSG